MELCSIMKKMFPYRASESFPSVDSIKSSSHSTLVSQQGSVRLSGVGMWVLYNCHQLNTPMDTFGAIVEDRCMFIDQPCLQNTGAE